MHGMVTVWLQVPSDAEAGDNVEFTTPETEGLTLLARLPEGFAPGSQFSVSYIPPTPASELASRPAVGVSVAVTSIPPRANRQQLRAPAQLYRY